MAKKATVPPIKIPPPVSIDRIELSGEFAALIAWHIVHHGGSCIPPGDREFLINGRAFLFLKNGDAMEIVKNEQHSSGKENRS